MWLRSTITLAPPARGPARGRVGGTSHPAVRLAVVGESTAAGCGVASHDEGFTGALAREVTARTTWVTMPGVPGPDFFADDRFHLSAAGYREWARVVAGHLSL